MTKPPLPTSTTQSKHSSTKPISIYVSYKSTLIPFTQISSDYNPRQPSIQSLEPHAPVGFSIKRAKHGVTALRPSCSKQDKHPIPPHAAQLSRKLPQKRSLHRLNPPSPNISLTPPRLPSSAPFEGDSDYSFDTSHLTQQLICPQS